MAKKPALGRGLAALLGEEQAATDYLDGLDRSQAPRRRRRSRQPAPADGSGSWSFPSRRSGGIPASRAGPSTRAPSRSWPPP